MTTVYECLTVQNTLGSVQQRRRVWRATRQPSALASAAVERCGLTVQGSTLTRFVQLAWREAA